MAAYAAADLLAAWELARRAPVSARATALLRAFGRLEPATLGAMTQGLLSVFQEAFGPLLDGVATCPACGTDVELSIPVAELTGGARPPSAVEPFVVDGFTVHWRLPDQADVAAAGECADAEEGAVLLLSRIVLGAGGPLPPGAREQLAQRVAAADPLAEVILELACPHCAMRWESPLDVAGFVWAHLHSRAQRLLGEVDEIARVYGWSETDILALSQVRRDAYLALIRHD